MRLLGDDRFWGKLPKFELKQKVLLNIKEPRIAKIRWRFYQPDLEEWWYSFYGLDGINIAEEGLELIK